LRWSTPRSGLGTITVAREINRFEEKGAVRSFCRVCGTPLIYERTRSRHMINIPRSLFQSRTGRQPIYHIAIEDMRDWAYTGEPLVPLKGYPGVFCKRSKKSRVQEACRSGTGGLGDRLNSRR
jgi:hypothetical protein